MWLRLNRVQTADLRIAAFTDPSVAREVKTAIDEGRHYNDSTLVLFTPPIVARTILRWSEAKGRHDAAHNRGARIMRERYVPQQRQPPWVAEDEKGLRSGLVRRAT
jgi:hypothetical protein